MEKPVSVVLKKSQVRLRDDPQVRGAAPACDDGGGSQARIVAAGETEAVIEVTCSCGRTARVRCTYARPG